MLRSKHGEPCFHLTTYLVAAADLDLGKVLETAQPVLLHRGSSAPLEAGRDPLAATALDLPRSQEAAVAVVVAQMTRQHSAADSCLQVLAGKMDLVGWEFLQIEETVPAGSLLHWPTAESSS